MYRQNGRITFMFNAFEGAPRVIRLFAKAKVYEREDPEFEKPFNEYFPDWNTLKFRLHALHHRQGYPQDWPKLWIWCALI